MLLKGAKFTFSYYVFASEADALVYGRQKGLPHVGETTTLTLGGQEYTFQSRFLYGYEGVANQGSGYSQANGIWIHYTGGGNGWNENAEYLNNPETAGFALGKGKNLTPYIHVAADQSVAPKGSLLYAPGLSQTPSGGLVTVKDAGGKIVGPILDQFVGFGLNTGYEFKNTYERLPSPVYIAVKDAPLTVNPSEFASRTMK